MHIQTLALGLAGGLIVAAAHAQERQITFTPKNHMLDNNDNFSTDGRFLCYDTREGIGSGIENSQSIEMVEIASGKETVLYAPHPTITGKEAAPGIGAVTFAPHENSVAFIHGPPVDEVEARGYYGKPNRNGASVPADGSQKLTWLDHRDVADDRGTSPGAHRGGTHRHEYSLDGSRIGFTYDDFLLPEYDRTVGYLQHHPNAPGNATHHFALLVAVTKMGESKPGEIEKAYGDSWVGREGTMRAFIGKVRNDDGETYTESLFVADVPKEVDITTADSGSHDRFPRPPKGVNIRRLTHTHAEGIVRGTPDGDRIAYYATAPDGKRQVFIIPSDGSDRDPDESKRPVQATHFTQGAGPGLRWHPSGNSIACIADNHVAVTRVKPGPRFGESQYLTPPDAAERSQLVWSTDGTILAFNKPIPTKDDNGNHVRTYDGSEYSQIFAIDFPDSDGDGIIDY
jgi:hypothetical protein